MIYVNRILALAHSFDYLAKTKFDTGLRTRPNYTQPPGRCQSGARFWRNFTFLWMKIEGILRSPACYKDNHMDNSLLDIIDISMGSCRVPELFWLVEEDPIRTLVDFPGINDVGIGAGGEIIRTQLTEETPVGVVM